MIDVIERKSPLTDDELLSELRNGKEDMSFRELNRILMRLEVNRVVRVSRQMKGKRLAGKAPSTLITDGAYNFNSAFRHAFWRENKALAIRHERHVRFQGDLDNQKMERMNGEIRDREKTVRGVKKESSPLISGLRIYHNYVRPHMGLKGKTPAEAAGINVEGTDKWMTLIQNASIKHGKIQASSSRE